MLLELEASVTGIIGGLANPVVPLLDIDFLGDPPMDARGRAVIHARFQVVVAPSAPFALERGGTILRRGFVQVDVYAPLSSAPGLSAQAVAREAGERIVNAFPRLTQLGLARVERPSYASVPLKEAPYYRVPVTIPWSARVPEGA